MKRSLCWVAVLGVVGVPAAAAACWPRWGRPVFAPRTYSTPVYDPSVYAPQVYAPPPSYAAQPLVVCQPVPAQGYVLQPPRIEAAPTMATPSPAPASGAGTASPPTRGPMAEPVRPAGGTDAVVVPAPMPAKTDAPPKVEPPKVEPPKVEPPAFPPDLQFPKVEIPKNLQPKDKEKLPPLELPKEPQARPTPKVPAVGAPREPVLPATPSPAPAPEPLIPPPSVPLVPDPNKRAPLPSLTLPPDTPVKTDSTSRSSPLTGARELSVNVFPASGPEKVAEGYRTVGFYNHTARDLALTIEGRAVKLPAKTYLHAQLAPTFTWSHSDRPTVRESVPEGAGGLDVVFRD